MPSNFWVCMYANLHHQKNKQQISFIGRNDAFLSEQIVIIKFALNALSSTSSSWLQFQVLDQIRSYSITFSAWVGCLRSGRFWGSFPPRLKVVYSNQFDLPIWKQKILRIMANESSEYIWLPTGSPESTSVVREKMLAKVWKNLNCYNFENVYIFSNAHKQPVKTFLEYFFETFPNLITTLTCRLAEFCV